MNAQEIELRRIAVGPPRSRLRFAVRDFVKKTMDRYVNFPTNLAALLCRAGATGAAEKYLGAVFDADPYNFYLGERLGDVIFDNGADKFPVGSVERGVYILHAMARSVASDRLSAAYMENLHALMAGRQRRSEPARVVVGMGTGRTGSTTLAGILALAEDSLSTHENPPLVYWNPQPRQVDFHIERLRVLRPHYGLLFDCSYWWINMLDAFFAAFPDGKAIGLYRDTEATVKSYMKIIPKTDNRWVAPYNGIWVSELWDPTYPHYEIPADARRDPDAAKRAHIRRYVVEYNERMRALAERDPERILLLRTEDLDDPATRQTISAFVGVPLAEESVRLNVHTSHDSSSGSWWS